MVVRLVYDVFYGHGSQCSGVNWKSMFTFKSVQYVHPSSYLCNVNNVDEVSFIYCCVTYL